MNIDKKPQTYSRGASHIYSQSPIRIYVKPHSYIRKALFVYTHQAFRLAVRTIGKGKLFIHPGKTARFGTGFPPTGKVAVHDGIKTRTVIGNKQVCQLMNDHMLNAPYGQQ